MHGSSDKPAPRAIRSYVLRAGRITPAQQRALDEYWPRFGVEFERDGPLREVALRPGEILVQ